MDIEGVKGSVSIAHNSLQTYGDKDISDSLIKHNIMHLISAVHELTKELNRRELYSYKYEKINILSNRE
jgi:hypothetical protein